MGVALLSSPADYDGVSGRGPDPRAMPEGYVPVVNRVMTVISSDKQALFVRTFHEHYDDFFYVAVSLLRNAADAEEAVSEAMLRAWRNLPNLENAEAIGGWIKQITRNVAIDVIKKRDRRPESPLATEVDPPAPKPEAEAVPAEDLDGVLDAIKQLSPGQRNVLELRFRHGLSPGDIAERLNLKSSTVSMRMRRGIEKLRELRGLGDAGSE